MAKERKRESIGLLHAGKVPQNPENVKDLLDLWGGFLISEVYQSLRTDVGLTPDRADRLLENVWDKAGNNFDRSLDPKLRAALGQTKLPFPTITSPKSESSSEG